MAITRRRKLVFALVLLPIFVLIVTEVVLRVFMGNMAVTEEILDPGDGRCLGLKPGFELEYTGWLTRIPAVTHDANSLGYRGRPHPKEKPEGVFRIAMLGDSFVYGQGVNTEETFCARLEEVLARRGYDGVEVLNFGIPGLNIEESTEQLRFFASQWNPDLALFVLFSNDLEPSICSMDRDHSWLWGLLYYSYTARLLLMPSRIFMAVGEEGPPAGDQERVARLRTALHDMRTASADCGAGLGVIALDDPLVDPRAERLAGELPDAAVERKLRPIFEALELSWCNAVPWMMQRGCGRIPGEGHFTAEGNRCVAERMADWLVAHPELFPGGLGGRPR